MNHKSYKFACLLFITFSVCCRIKVTDDNIISKPRPYAVTLVDWGKNEWKKKHMAAIVGQYVIYNEPIANRNVYLFEGVDKDIFSAFYRKNSTKTLTDNYGYFVFYVRIRENKQNFFKVSSSDYIHGGSVIDVDDLKAGEIRDIGRIN